MKPRSKSVWMAPAARGAVVPRRMLDVGTGTGILALAGALWGAAEVTAVDVKPEAVAAARANAARNGLAARVRVSGELPPPNFDSCPATKTEWAFSPDGGVYGCTATVGHAAHRLGTFFPEERLDAGAVSRWSGRSALTIPACQGCSLAPVCGGGCGAVAWRRTGTPNETDCRPVRELYGLGARYHRLGQ